MKTSFHFNNSPQPAFALISVLALVSLAALTATAFLASARLERSATRPLGETTRLQMVLNTGRECAVEVINRMGEPYWSFVTTYWRDKPTDELGYPLIGKPSNTNNLVWYYYCGFTPATWTNLDGADMKPRIRIANTVCQATFSNDIKSFMSNATSGLTINPPPNSKICTEIRMVGGRTSPPVGWVYIKQDIRTSSSTTNTANLPVARFAYFIEDLQGLIDAERMGGTNIRSSGTNPEEISLTNLVGSTAANVSLTTYTNKRPQYLTPGMLLSTNGGAIENTNDLRYFATRLRSCYWRTNDSNWGRIPMVPISSISMPIGGYYPVNAGVRSPDSRKIVLNNLNQGGRSIIAATILSNFPNFTNRAGGMDGNLYINALAANIIDYADLDSIPTTVSVNGVNAVGYDSYPLLTHVYDRFVCVTNGNSPPTIRITSYLQFWNLASSVAPQATHTVNYRLNDTIHSVAFSNGTAKGTNSTISALMPAAWTTNLTIPQMPPNSVYITNINNNITIPNSRTVTGYAWSNFDKVWINSNATVGAVALATVSNSISVAIGTNTNMNLRYGCFRPGFSLTNNETNFAGVVLGVKGQGNQAPGVLGQAKLLADPRMNNYITLTNGVGGYNNTFWGAYPSETNIVNPSIWPDGTPSNALSSIGVRYVAPSPPNLGLFTLLDLAPCKISNTNGYTNICELGNIFDPMQWRPPPPLITATNYVNTNITSTWTADSLYGGGSTLRIGRPEHSRFAFTNLTTSANSYPVPALGTSAAGLLDLFCVTNTYDCAGKININTAPLPVLAALAGGITVSNTSYSGSAPTNQMIDAFTNGVARFRNTYPFITPSQLAFISSDYGTTTTFTNSWPTNAVFSTNASGGLSGPTAINDQGLEEWFSKIYNLTTVQSFNYRIYVKAQMTDTNGNPKGPELRKYYQIYLRNNTPTGGAATWTPNVSPVVTYEAFY